jgi:hypothetical protein
MGGLAPPVQLSFVMAGHYALYALVTGRAIQFPEILAPYTQLVILA